MGHLTSKLVAGSELRPNQRVPRVPGDSEFKKILLPELSQNDEVRILVAEGAEFIRSALLELEKELGTDHGIRFGGRRRNYRPGLEYQSGCLSWRNREKHEEYWSPRSF